MSSQGRIQKFFRVGQSFSAEGCSKYNAFFGDRFYAQRKSFSRFFETLLIIFLNLQFRSIQQEVWICQLSRLFHIKFNQIAGGGVV